MKRIKMEPEGMLSQDDDIMALLHQDDNNLDIDQNYSLDVDGDDDNILMQHMDIREPLATLRTLLEQRLATDLSKWSFWLQDAQMLESHKNLVDQCVQGEGLVQINVQLRPRQRRINIVDVLKPADDYNDLDERSNGAPMDQEESKNVIRWMIDANYKKEQDRLKIPSDPNEWSPLQVKHWLQWAVRQFKLSSIRLSDWNINGSQLCGLTIDEFHAKVPHDPGDVFWTHLELLRKCKFVAVIQREPSEQPSDKLECIPIKEEPQANSVHKPRQVSSPFGRVTPNISVSSLDSSNMQGVPLNMRCSNSGQIQLWQFLLELLTDKEHKDSIQWVGTDGEFKLNQPEAVAQLWGARKNKPSMNYEKLSRALRYYYDGDMISKVHGKRFVYKFVCDLKQLLGYSAAELSRLVDEDDAYYN